MDEVNHVKMVVSLCYCIVLDYFPCLSDGYECGMNVLFGERLLRFLLCRLLKCLIAFRQWWVFYIWYQSEVEMLGPIGLKTLQHVSFLTND